MPGSVFLAGESVELRTIEEEDLDFCRSLINSPEIRHTLGSVLPKNSNQEQEWFEEQVSDDDHVHLAIAVDGDIVGTVSIWPVDHPDGKAEIGIMVAEEFWGNGYGTEASRLIIAYTFDELRKHRVVARVFEGNEGSRRIWEKLGFRHEATHVEAKFFQGEYIDVYRYAMLEDEWRKRE